MNDDDFDDFFRVAYPRLVAMGLAMSTERHVAQEPRRRRCSGRIDGETNWRPMTHPIAWCRRVMGNLLIDQHRSRTSERSAVERLQEQVPGPRDRASETDPAALVASRRWSDLVASLSPQQRLVATLYYAEDQSVATIAETMQIASGTVKSALSKARTNLRRVLDAPSSDGEGPRS